MKLSDYIAQYLVKIGVKHVFGYQGGAITHIIDSIVKTGRISYIQNYHEQASAFSADAYSRVTNTLGVAIATNGPGATNLVTGIANAYLDSVPVLFITGQVNTFDMKQSCVRQNGFQELDIVNVVKPITKYAVTVTDPCQICYELEKAIQIAQEGRPGAVLIDLPVNIQGADIDISKLIGYSDAKMIHSNELRIQEIIGLLQTAKAPLILLGGGVRIANAAEEVKQLVQLTDIPVVNTLMGLDVVTKNNIGFSGVYGNTYTNLALLNADVLIVLGSRLAVRQVGKMVDKYTKAKVIHIDIDNNELGHSLKEDISIQADLKCFLSSFIQQIKDDAIQFPSYENWINLIVSWRKLHKNSTRINKVGVDPVEFIQQVSNLCDENTIYCFDVGQHQMWAAQGINIKDKQRVLNSGGLGSMGFGLPAAIGAAFAKPDANIIVFVGDGGLQMNIQELQMLHQYSLNIKIFVLNNKTLGMIREVQRKYYESNYVGTDTEYYKSVNISLLSQLYHLEYLEVDSLNQMIDISKLINKKGPCIVDVRLDSNTSLITRYDQEHIYSTFIADSNE